MLENPILASTEMRHAAAQGLHRQPSGAILGQLHRAQRQALDAVDRVLPALETAADVATAALSGGHRLIYAGAGSSGLMALSDCLELAGTFGLPPVTTPMLLAGGAGALLHMQGAVEDDPARAVADLARLVPVPGDVLIAVSASGDTPYTLAIARSARAAGAIVIGIANVPDCALLCCADVAVLLETGPELIAGSTRMGAGTAQKVALNMISALTGIRLGHVHDGLMVNLTADNAKLAGRAARIVAAIAGCDAAAAEQALARSGGAVKPAILIARGADPGRADGLLARSGGHLDPALAALADAAL